MKKHFNHKKALYIMLMVLGTILLYGCQSKESQQVDEEATYVEETLENQEDENLKLPQLEVEVINVVEKKYEDILGAYRSALPIKQSDEPVSSDAQKVWVKDMRTLYDEKGTSKAIYDLYKEGISKLASEEADLFTAYAISGMRRNSFEDYSDLESYVLQPDFLDRFFLEAKPYDYKYIKLSQNVDKIEDAEIKALLLAAKNQGYYIASAEGMLFYLVDFTEFAKNRDYNTKPMRDLLITLAIDSLEPMASDGGFVVDGDTIAARTYGMEKMLEEYEGTLYERYMAIRFKDHMSMLLMGIDNSPTFDYDNQRLKEDSIRVFKEIQTLEDSYMAELVTDFMELVSSNNHILDESVRGEAYELLNRIDDKYNLTMEDVSSFGTWMSGLGVEE
ncbi:hypothetical protein [Petrocella sp. FN5]|uniref:hypothetical protein n=1 Tax=Petrocella sp. FN5 TaxID=3032002 RepID=UPI0023D99DE1|nr:hypothetical protein [Petrocella sp. FN5]MDF1615862.1 hypothetical protein [Petrocella sp. FN5]